MGRFVGVPAGGVLLACVVAGLFATPAHAGDDASVRRAIDAYLAEASPSDLAPPGGLGCAVADEGEPWTFMAAIYLWATGIDGDVDARGNTSSVDVPFSELFDDLTGAFMGRFGARKGKWGILVDIFWASLEDSTTGPVGGTITTEMDLFINELTGSYRVGEHGEAEKGLFTLDVYAGARVYSVEVEITSTLVNTEESETWVDPIVGLDARFSTGKWVFLVRADIGGFEISSELCWSVMAGVAFRCSRVFSLAAGYRLLDIDFEDGPVVDIRLSGPFLGMAFSW